MATAKGEANAAAASGPCCRDQCPCLFLALQLQPFKIGFSAPRRGRASRQPAAEPAVPTLQPSQLSARARRASRHRRQLTPQGGDLLGQPLIFSRERHDLRLQLLHHREGRPQELHLEPVAVPLDLEGMAGLAEVKQTMLLASCTVPA